MPTLLRWTLRGLMGLAAFVVGWTGVWGVPASIAEQVVFFGALNDEVYIRVLALILAFALALIAVGPTRVQAWVKWTSDRWHADARQIERLEREKSRLEDRNERLQERLNAHEGRDLSTVIAKIEKKGAVELKGKQASTQVAHLIEGGVWYDTYLVPYKVYETGKIDLFDDPTVVIEAEGEEDAFLIDLAYDVQSTSKYEPSRGLPQIEITVRLQVLNERKKTVREPTVYTGRGNLLIGGLGSDTRWWRHTVSCSAKLSGLPKGNYGLNVFEHMRSDLGAREYRDLRLVVTKFGRGH